MFKNFNKIPNPKCSLKIQDGIFQNTKESGKKKTCPFGRKQKHHHTTTI